MKYRSFTLFIVLAFLSLASIGFAQNKLPFFPQFQTGTSDTQGNSVKQNNNFLSSFFSGFGKSSDKEENQNQNPLITPTPPLPRVNVALASNGGVASASSVNDVPPSAANLANDGVRNWATTQAWKDNTADAYPDWLQVDFNNSYIVNEVNIYFVRDDYTNPTDPDDTTVSTLYGVTAFDVQYWNGTSWATVAGGSISNNTKTLFKLTFPAVQTNKMRVLVNNAQNSYSRIVEFEVYQGGTLATPTPTPTPTPSRQNVALAANGGTASASSQYPSIVNAPSAANNGFRNWSQSNSWKDNTPDAYPDWLQIDFNGTYNINEINLYFVRDDYTNPVDPDETTVFTTYGVTAFDVQYWNGTSWVTLPGGSVTNNNKVLFKLTFPTVTTSRVRVVVNNAQASYSRIVEFEAYTAIPSATEVKESENSLFWGLLTAIFN